MLFLGHELDYEIDTPLVPCTRVILLRRRKIFDKSPIHLWEFEFHYRPQFRKQTIAARPNLVHANKPHKRIAVDFDGHCLSMSVLGPFCTRQRANIPSNRVFN
jgi:hypothetical protein